MTTVLKDYQHKYSSAELTRDGNGVLLVQFHTNGGSLIWSETAHRELAGLFGDVADDRDNRVVILTGKGPNFITETDNASLSDVGTPNGWDKIYFEGRRMLRNLLDIECPVIGALNGPVTEHCELILLSDVVLCSESATLKDGPHFANGLVPGDGINLLLPLVMGLNRARYFLLMGQRLSANEMLDVGIVSEVLPPSQLLARANEIAKLWAAKPSLTLKYTRTALVHTMRKLMIDQLGYGLALEGNALVAMGTENFEFLPQD
ncbi:enoyl-CoA hydratase/isomerase family protein [Mycobacterium sp. CVI_P3]|uniref:Enoyl-CoA hydratase/isomerase family protein n=1 Tax=Mycobacterium pinniadriaticum TaxID=2994102 RepID=A0ABT3SF21_9MYCO|nr:enoyl-CoA hydratase/isomerase family protein [Mycobacterium pinniadriaticum]MCX2931806.1 enoyl-CoA hydratase/isomerase family protein [Mycobacterium pinniadriaticum]MCX2938119.1 enoyl-CoA hydratase/isomerase family protein [Mycobacterium pinniadriaticum]